MSDSPFRVEPGASRDADPCPCCGLAARGLSGFVHEGPDVRAAYLLRWVPDRPDHGASVDLILGDWGDAGSPERRRVVSLRFGPGPHGDGFRILDAAPRPGVAESGSRRDEVAGTPLANEVFRMLEAVWEQDERTPRTVSNPRK